VIGKMDIFMKSQGYMKIKILLVLALLSSKFVFGQHNQISFLYGFGSYRMNDLKKFQQFNLASVNPQISAKLLEDFPVNNYMQGTWEFSINDRLKMGFILGYHTTGSQIHYADYTGQLSFRIITKACNLGIKVERTIVQWGKFEIDANAEFSFYSTVIKTEDVLIVLNDKKSETNRYETVSPALEPGILINYSIKPFIIGLYAGYLYDSGAKLYRNYNDSSPYIFYGLGELKSNWTGYRIGGVVGFTF
jgi:hypothetical protein